VASNNEWIASVILSHGDSCDAGVRKMELFNPKYDRLGWLRRKIVSFFMRNFGKSFCGYLVRVGFEYRESNEQEASCGFDWSRTKKFLMEHTSSLNSSTFPVNYTFLGHNCASSVVDEAKEFLEHYFA